MAGTPSPRRAKTTAKRSPAAAKRGTAGTRGPVPKRSSERRRRNSSSKVETVKVDAPIPSMPPVDPAWHEIARSWYLSLADSGQAQFYEPSDWQAARFVAEVMSRNLRQKAKFSSMLFTAVWAAMGDLLTTEADRRRVRMEIERGGDDASKQLPAGVTAIAGYRERLAAGGASG